MSDRLALAGFHFVFPAAMGALAINVVSMRHWWWFALAGCLIVGPWLVWSPFCEKGRRLDIFVQGIVNGIGFWLGSWVVWRHSQGGIQSWFDGAAVNSHLSLSMTLLQNHPIQTLLFYVEEAVSDEACLDIEETRPPKKARNPGTFK